MQRLVRASGYSKRRALCELVGSFLRFINCKRSSVITHASATL